jgi:MFS family permease
VSTEARKLSSAARPTNVRYLVLVMAIAVAILLYVDRFCVSNATKDIKSTLDLSDLQVSWLLAAFFYTYAFGQLGGGWLADRFGARRVLTVAIAAWSTCTGLIGFAVGFWDLLAYRFLCGLFESVAYPACAGVIRSWFPASARGFASGGVSLGGRAGAFLTPKMTVVFIALSASLLPAFASWRPVFWLFGVLGIGTAGLFWIAFRDRPEQHPAANGAECELIALGNKAPAPPVAMTSAAVAESPKTAERIAAEESGALPSLPVRIATNRSLWLCSIVQAGSNFGWVFLFTLLPIYLYEVHRTERATNGTMCSSVGLICLPSVILGGLLADFATHRLGRRWGRSLPMAVPRFVAAGLYILVGILSFVWLDPQVEAPGLSPNERHTWTFILLFGFIAFFSDLTLPAIWAYNLDVGGKSAGVVLGWGNMWGNLGAAFSPTLLILAERNWGWTSVFWLCGGVFFAIAVLSLFVDATEIVDA